MGLGALLVILGILLWLFFNPIVGIILLVIGLLIAFGRGRVGGYWW